MHARQQIQSAVITPSGPNPVRQAELRLLRNTPLMGIAVVPSAAALPLAAQRDFRGLIVVGIMLFIVTGIALSIFLVMRIRHRDVYFAPTAEHIGAATAVREATDFEALTQAQMLVSRLETYSPATAPFIWKVLLPFLHPSLHQKMRLDLDEVAHKAKSLWQHRVAIPLGAAGAGRNAGIITVAVFYESAELTGKSGQPRILGSIIDKAAYIEFAMDAPSHENPIGLVMTRYQTLERPAWLARGFPDLWDTYRKPPPEGK